MLVASTQEPGLWTNTDRKDSEAGTFVVIIGVSQYLHLEDGEKPVQQNYGLGQLRVSALTAYEFFEWVSKEYHIDGSPIAKVWLLLSPTKNELKYKPQLAVNSLPATFANCQHAIGNWWAQMSNLNKKAAQNSRSIFFFSGHGLEIHYEQQILLPSDYLHPPAQNWDEAISTQNIRNGLASLLVPRQFFFIDACRNDHRELRKKKITGSKILREDEAALANPALIAPVLYATASGQQAFQQPEPDKGLSLYGRALLDGLAGKPDIELKPQDQRWSVNLYSLQSFVTGRVNDMLKVASEEVIQPIKLSGLVDNQAITYIGLDQINTTHPVDRLASAADMQLLVAAGARTSHERSDSVARQMDEGYALKIKLSNDLTRNVWANDFSRGHELFGSEHVTQVWSQQIRVFELSRKNWLDYADMFQIHEISRSYDTRHYQVELSISNHDPIGHWIELVDTTGASHGCVLPGDRYVTPRYVLEFDVPYSDNDGRPISRLEAYLSVHNQEPLASAARLWLRYRTADITGAIEFISHSALGNQLGELESMTAMAGDMHELEELVRHKLQSPLAATIAALTLLRANRLDLLHTWLRNLANWCEERTDGPALWAEQLIRQATDRKQSAKDAAYYLIKLNERGLPHTNEGFSYAAAMTERLLQASKLDISDSVKQELIVLQEKINNVMPYFMPGGLYASFTGFETGTNPIELIGASTAVAHI